MYTVKIPPPFPDSGMNFFQCQISAMETRMTHRINNINPIVIIFIIETVY